MDLYTFRFQETIEAKNKDEAIAKLIEHLREIIEYEQIKQYFSILIDN